MDYWKQKEELKEKARQHTESMAQKFSSEISECIANSRIYGGPDAEPTGSKSRTEPNIHFLNLDSASALKMSRSEKKAVLNFASYKNPGGKFIEGSRAQEEMLCHSSFLYNVLREFPQYYLWNSEHKNRALYLDRAIYSPKIIFGDTACDVITCAAPNVGVGLKYGNVTKEENRDILEKRMAFIRDIAEENGAETFILGAFGCGVFRQDPEDVCAAIKKAFQKTSIRSLVIAVPGNDRNCRVFERNFE